VRSTRPPWSDVESSPASRCLPGTCFASGPAARRIARRKAPTRTYQGCVSTNTTIDTTRARNPPTNSSPTPTSARYHQGRRDRVGLARPSGKVRPSLAGRLLVSGGRTRVRRLEQHAQAAALGPEGPRADRGDVGLDPLPIRGTAEGRLTGATLARQDIRAHPVVEPELVAADDRAPGARPAAPNADLCLPSYRVDATASRGWLATSIETPGDHRRGNDRPPGGLVDRNVDRACPLGPRPSNSDDAGTLRLGPRAPERPIASYRGHRRW
jgi:hypothetical protein